MLRSLKRHLPRPVEAALVSGLEEVRSRRLRHKLPGLYRKYRAFTMVERPVFLDNLALIDSRRNLPGCVVECGVWRGGMIAAAAEVLGGRRSYFLFDSFEGLPAAQEIDGKTALAWQQDTASPIYFDNCRAEIEFSERAMALSGATGYTIVKGWFDKTLPGFVPPEPIAVLRLDSDWYSSTSQCLESLYPLVAPQGLVIVDDYYVWDGCARAVHDYLAKHQLADRIRTSKAGVCHIVKS